MPKLPRDEMERRRLAAGREILQLGRKRGVQAHIARKYGVAQATASRWCAAAYASGVKGLRGTKAKGAPSKMTNDQKAELLQIITSGATTYGFESDIWTGKRLAKVITERFGVEYNWKYIPQLLHEQLGLSWQKPNRRPRELDPAKEAAWLQNVWEPAKKNS